MWLLIHASVVCDRNWVNVLLSASLYLIYSHTQSTFFRFKEVRPLVESAVCCCVLSWQCTLSSWHLPSHAANSSINTKQQRPDVHQHQFYPVYFALPVPQGQSELDMTRSFHLVNTTAERNILKELEWLCKTKVKKPQNIHKKTEKGFKVGLNPSWVPRESWTLY